MATMQEITLAATSVDYVSTNYVAVSYSPNIGTSLGSIPQSAQTMRMFCWSDQSSGSATVRVVFRSKAKGNVLWVDDATITVISTNAPRRNNNGAGGDYLCTVSFGSSGTNKLDLMPWRTSHEDIEIRVGVLSLTTITSLDCLIGWDEDA